VLTGGQNTSDQVGIEMPEIGGNYRNGRDLEANNSTGFRKSSPGKYGVLQ
jgi:hypothetical protein